MYFHIELIISITLLQSATNLKSKHTTIFLVHFTKIAIDETDLANDLNETQLRPKRSSSAWPEDSTATNRVANGGSSKMSKTLN